MLKIHGYLLTVGRDGKGPVLQIASAPAARYTGQPGRITTCRIEEYGIKALTEFFGGMPAVLREAPHTLLVFEIDDQGLVQSVEPGVLQ